MIRKVKNTLLASSPIPLWPAQDKTKLEGLGPLGLEGIFAHDAGGVFANVISTAIGIMTLVAFIWFFFLVVIGGLGVMTSGGDKAKVAEARGRITSGLIGLVIVVSAIFIVQMVGALFGIKLFDVDVLIESIIP